MEKGNNNKKTPTAVPDKDSNASNETITSFKQWCEDKSKSVNGWTTAMYYKCLTDRIIMINSTLNVEGCIDDSLVETALIPLRTMIHDGSNKPIRIVINTDGGILATAMSLAHEIETSNVPITVEVLGRAYSAGTLLLMAGFKNKNVTRICSPYSAGLLHTGSYGASGNAEDVQEIATFNKRYFDKISKYVLSHSKISEKVYKNIRRKQYYMDAETMLKYGIVDKIV